MPKSSCVVILLMSLEDMTSGTDARRPFTTDEVVLTCLPAAWEGGIQQAIDKVCSSRREGNRLGALSDSRANGVDRPVAGGAESASDPTLLHRFPPAAG